MVQATDSHILILLFLGGYSFGQKKDIFEIVKEVKSEQKLKEIKLEIDSIYNCNRFFFEDEKYNVNVDCIKNWGGTVTFTNKITNSKFTSGSTCPIILNKFNGKYIVTNTSFHLIYNTEILEIINPEILKKYNESEKLKIDIIKGRLNTKTLLNKFYYCTLISFVFKKNFFHIVSNEKETFIAEIIDGEFKKRQSLLMKNCSTINSRIIRNSNNNFVLYYDNYSNHGIIEIKENLIKIISSI